ncbi:unnamed protein product [Miscanthus lutarioriparius]|uniref:DUF4408 domain-containing protein n=1 Tax=Miscanthus lutarioriparius TaxID=422564 RepID=A0A811P1T0_9POAL|nr:unnamed protein product [Miscanthus lutarioriparius]
MAAADARPALSRSRVVARALVHAAQVAGLVVLLRALAEFPWAAAAAPSILRFAASFLDPPRICFLAVNIIVVTLAWLFPHDTASLSPSSFADLSGSPISNGDAPQQHPFLAFLEDPRLQELPPITEAEPSREQAPPPPEEVFEDKEVMHVKTTVRAQPPRRTMSEKTTRDGAAATAAACHTSTTKAASPPELRRAKSENGRRRQRRSAAVAAAPAPVELGTDDAEAFRQAVEAFIAKQQTWFHREESMVIARAAAAAAGGEDGPGKIAGAAAVAVK